MSAYATASARPRDRLPPTKKRRKFNRELILRGLEIIGSIQAPLAPELPSYLSSASSRKPTPSDNSFASSSKRKLDAVADEIEGSAKRAKSTVDNLTPSKGHGTGTAHPSVTVPHPSPDVAKASPPPAELAKPAAYTGNLAKPEKRAGEVTNVGAGSSSRSPTLFEPVRRPRRELSSIDFKSLQTFYYNQARNFKYSGEGRLMAAHPPNHPLYKPLKEPPPKGSPYHTHSTLMAALETLEGLLSFAYSTWCQEHLNTAIPIEAWQSIHEYSSWVRSKWNMYVIPRDNVREKAFIGVIHMIEAFVRQRVVRSRLAPQMERRLGEAMSETNKMRAREVEKAKAKVVVPPEKSLPSPDTDAASASSTPATQNNGTPARKGDVKPDDLKRPNRPMSSEPPVATELISLPVATVETMQKLIFEELRSGMEMKSSQKTLSLAIMREHFPHTYARMVQSTLAAEDEHEPDMEDSEGELFWPNQCITGDGLAWVCLMGRAMTHEFGKDIGYLSINGIIPKPTST